MDVLACGHVAHPGASRLCQHLARPADERRIAFVRLLTGHGLDYDMCCTSCDTAIADGVPAQLVQACEGCVARCDEASGSFTRWRGTPGIIERPHLFDPTVTRTPLPAGLGAVIDLAAVTDHTGFGWLILTEAGDIARVAADTGESVIVGHSSVPDEPDHEPWDGHVLRRRLHAAPDGRTAAVVNDYGRHGQVIDLDTGGTTLVLDGGDYHPDTVPLSVALLHHRDRTIVVHRTAWNRLDVSDARTGRLLTPRQPASYVHGEARPDHYLNYFHGALHTSPTGRWLADDGWVWHPVGIPSVWDLRRWLDTNAWESEDGPTRKDLCQRDYYWNAPMCWLGDDLLAISGIGDDDLAMLPGARIFDVNSGVELGTFPGPQGAFFGTTRSLYSAAPDGLDIWDPFTGHRTGRLPGFRPTHHHPAAGELVALHDHHLLRWRIPPTSDPNVSQPPC